MVVLRVREVCYVYEDMWVVQWYCIFEGLVEMYEVVGVGLYWKLIGKMIGVGRFPFSQNFRNFRFGGKWNTFRRFVPLENSQKKWKI